MRQKSLSNLFHSLWLMGIKLIRSIMFDFSVVFNQQILPSLPQKSLSNLFHNVWLMGIEFVRNIMKQILPSLPQLCTINIYVIFHFAIVCEKLLFEWKRICAGFVIVYLLYIAIDKKKWSRESVGISLTDLKPPRCCGCPNSNVVYCGMFLLSDMRSEVIFPLIDFGGFYYHPCLPFLFMIQIKPVII